MSIPPRGSHDRLWPSGISRCDPSKPYNTSVAFLTENISGSRGGLLFGLQGRVVDSSSAKITVIRNKVTQFTPTACGSCNDDFSTGDRDQSQTSPIMSSGPSETSASPRESHWLSMTAENMTQIYLMEGKSAYGGLGVSWPSKIQFLLRMICNARGQITLLARFP